MAQVQLHEICCIADLYCRSSGGPYFILTSLLRGPLESCFHTRGFDPEPIPPAQGIHPLISEPLDTSPCVCALCVLAGGLLSCTHSVPTALLALSLSISRGQATLQVPPLPSICPVRLPSRHWPVRFTMSRHTDRSKHSSAC